MCMPTNGCAGPKNEPNNLIKKRKKIISIDETALGGRETTSRIPKWSFRFLFHVFYVLVRTTFSLQKARIKVYRH